MVHQEPIALVSGITRMKIAIKCFSLPTLDHSIAAPVALGQPTISRWLTLQGGGMPFNE